MSVELVTEQPSVAKESVGRKILAFAGRHQFLLFSFLVLALAVIYINPFHETSISDDWAYILTTHHLYDTGQFELHPWAAANILFQSYWGLVFAWIGGFSIGTLHLSTLATLLIGIVSLYLLAQEHGLDRKVAGLLAFCLAVCPPVLYLSLTFMSDVPALSFIILALFLYTRGLKRQSRVYMLAGGLATLAGMFIRPTDLAVFAGLGAIFLLDKERLRRWQLYAAGGIGPLVGGLVLVAGGTGAKLGTASPNGLAQSKFMSQPDVFLTNVLLWRPALFLMYLAFFAMPLVFAGTAGMIMGGPGRLKLRPVIVAAFGIVVVSGLVFNVVGLGGGWRMPYIGYVSDALDIIPALGWLVTLIVIPGGVLVGAVIWERVGSWKRWAALPLEQRLLDVVTLFLLLYSLVWFGLADRYLLGLLPFTFIVLGRFVQPAFARVYRLVVVIGIIVVIITAMITRFFQGEQAAEWAASNYALTMEAAPLKIYGHWGWYASYNFYDFQNLNPNKADNGFMSGVWLPLRRSEADYQTAYYKEDRIAEGWTVVKIFSYSDPLFQDRPVYLLKRPGL